MYIHTCKLYITAFHVNCIIINKCIPLNEYISSVSDEVYVKFTCTAAGKLSLWNISWLFAEAASQFIYLGSRAYCCSCELPSSSLLIQQVRHDRKGMQIYLAHFIYYIPQVGLGSGFSVRISDFSFTNSLATSSLVLCDSILRMVHPVSSIWIRLPSDSQHAHEPCSTMSLSCITATPTRRSSRAKQ